jgi:glycosyltransferase involved in cell wall biosynthesis
LEQLETLVCKPLGVTQMDKVFFLSGAFPPQTGGELYNYQLSKYLEEAGFEVEYVDLHQKRKYLRLGLIPVVGDILASLVLAVMLYRCNGILIEDHYFSRYLFLTNIIQRFFRKGKIIVLVHLFYGYESDDHFLFRRWLEGIKEKARLSFADLIVTSSEYSKSEIVSLKINPLSVHVLPPGLDREKFELLPQPEEEQENKKVLCVGNYVPRKGIIYLIEGFSKIERKSFTLHLVGNRKNNSTYYNKLLAVVKELNLTDCVFFYDGSDKEKIKYLYSSSDIFVLPSLKETFGIVFLEAMHYGLPIVTTNVSAMPELITDGENGLLVPPADSQALAKALSKLVENRELREQLGERGCQRIKNAYYWEQTSSKFLSLVQSISS